MSKSQMIRDFKAANPDAKPRDIAAALKKRGVSTSATYVSTILSNAKKAGQKKSGRARKASSDTAQKKFTNAATTAAADTVSTDALYKMKAVVDDIGFDEASLALSTIEQLGVA